MQEAENVWFEELRILCPVLWEIVHDRKRTCGSLNRMFSLIFRMKHYERRENGHFSVSFHVG